MDDFFDSLILSGAVEVSSIDPATGDFLYSFTPKIREVAPEMAAAADKLFYDQMMILWTKQIISMDVTSPNPTVRITEKAFDEEVINQLSEQSRETLSFLMKMMRKE
jgi:hypothetical protein